MIHSVLTKTSLLLTFMVIFCGCSEVEQQQKSAAKPQQKPLTQTNMPDTVVFSDMHVSISMAAPRQLLPIGPGDKAPALQLAGFVKGEPIAEFEAGHIYIIEFWATWCSPCLQTLPYVARLQSKYCDDVTVIAITAEDEQTVTHFLAEEVDADRTWGEVLNFRIALDDQRRTQKRWRETSEDAGLPFTMIVGRTGLIEWAGHPTAMAIPLKDIVNDNWDRQVAHKLMKQAIDGQGSIDRNQQAIVTAVNAGNYHEAVGITDRMLEVLPNNRKILALQKQLLVDGQLYGRMNRVFAKLIQLNNDNPTELNSIAWNISAELQIPERDLSLALKAAQRAAELSDHQNASILDTVARVHYERGELEEAIDWQERAVKIQPTSQQLIKVLKGYRSKMESQAVES